MRFTQIPTITFQQLQINAGVLAYNFNPDNGTLYNRDIIGATSGGITFSATPTLMDFGEDIDNCPKNTMELKRIREWEVKISGTFVTINPESAAKLVGAARKTITGAQKTTDTSINAGKQYYTRSGSGTTQSPYVYTPVAYPLIADIGTYYEATSAKITPQPDLSSDAFSDLWLVGDYSDMNDFPEAGFIAVKVMNALSTGGFSLATADREKGKLSFEFIGHVSINSQNVVPFEIYMHTGEEVIAQSGG
ncbi:MAG: hypothetical protein J5643_07400 [Lachnospiraceae bacterium]|nr:hypothetical protein [Lachnospiraceae bacterium]